MIRRLAPLLFIFIFAPYLYAAQISKVKGSQALINLQGEPMSPGDTFFALEGGKKKAIIKIVKVKGDKAIAKVLKGNASVGMTLAARSSGGGAAAGSSASSSGGGSGRSYWGGMLGLGLDSMTATVNSATTPGATVGNQALSGTGFAGMGLFDYELFPQIWFRGLFGIENFNVAGGAICGNGNSQACNATIMYLAGDFIARYVFAMDDFRPWLGVGVELMFPVSNSTTVLSSSSIGATNVIQPMLGFDWFISPTMFVPVSVEYGLLPKSSNVSASWIEFRVGIGFPF